jgi:hypothetical protein
MDKLQALTRLPHLASPAALAMADSGGKWVGVGHLLAINDALIRAWRTANSRLGITVPFQHGKSLLCSIYFPAWVLLMWPETRIGLASYNDSYAAGFGAKVRDIVVRYGPALGVTLREDTRAKDEWVVDKVGVEDSPFLSGGMVCRGRGAGFIGRPVDLLILDDMIKDAEEAQSPTVLENLWDWYCTVAYSRLGPTAPVISVGTRWGPKDLFGRWEAEAKVGGEKFEHIVFTAIAKKNDILGRKEGEALWPERVPLARLEMVQRRRPRWFEACWQGNPMEGEGLHFQPKNWPRYSDVGDACRFKVGFNYNNYRKAECWALIAIDWAQRGKKDSDKTAFVAALLTPDGYILILDVFNQQLRIEQNAPALAAWCQRWRWGDVAGLIVASDDDMLSEAMVTACKQHKSIPDIKRLGIRSRNKKIRAEASVNRSQDGKFLVPDPEEKWYAEFEEQLRTFTGVEGAEDDIVDCIGILGRLANDWYPAEEYEEDYEPLLGSGGYSTAW